MKSLGYTFGLMVVLTSLSALMAQPGGARDAGSKIRDGGMAHGAQMYQNHAQNRAQILYYYSQAQQPVPQAEAKELVSGIKADLTAADQALAKLKEEHAKEPEVVKLIGSIEKHHAKAHEICGMAEEHCLKEHGDHVAIADCCSGMWHEIDAARVETEKLLKLLKIDKLPVPKPAKSKKQ